MNDWKESNIKSLGTVFTNNTFSRDCLNYDSGEYQNIHYGDVLITFSDVIDANSPLVPYINSNETVKSDTFIEDGDIIVADTAEDETVGKVCEIQNVGKRKFVSGLHTLWYRPNKNEFAPKYLGYLLNTFECHKQLVRKAHGIKVLSINKGDFWKTIIKYPASLNEQNAIAGIISKVDQCIENTQKTIDATQKLKKSLMQNLLTGRMKPDGTMRKDNEFYDHPKMGKIPIGWEINILKDIFTINDESLSSKTDPKFKFRYITIESINTENIDYENCPTYNFEDAPGRARRIIKDNDLLISGVRPNLKGFAIYKKPNDENWICTTGCYVLRAKEQQDYRFYFYQILSDIGASQFYGWVSGTNYPAISDRDIRRLKLYSPTNYEEQKEIANKIDLITKQITEKQNKINKLKILKKSLMQNLLTGKIRVDVEKINHLLESMK
ncbi:MAG: restriction endonuclease subunit S [Treponema sp.]|nr:restriction endonuclease subunit S [Treponema sp.]